MFMCDAFQERLEYAKWQEGKRSLRMLTIIGAHPKHIRVTVVSRELGKHDDISEVLVHTVQHYDINMLDVSLEEFDIPKPDYNLGTGSATQGMQTARTIEVLEDVLIEGSPDCVIVYGDTNSIPACPLATARLHSPVAHVEAGLHSFNRRMPEEINRIATVKCTSCANGHFCGEPDA